MRMKEERESLIHWGNRLLQEGLTKGTGGNLSTCCRKSGLMAITPSGIPYPDIQPNQVVVMDIETGAIVEGDAVPSSECDMHRIFYKYRTDLQAIIHTHSTFAATIACLGWSLPAVHYLVAFAGVDVRCAPYATYGTVALAKNAYAAMEDRKAVLLANHGLLAGGRDLADAFAVTEEIEFCCELYYRTKSIGNPYLLSDNEMQRMVQRFQDYGKRIEEHDEI